MTHFQSCRHRGPGRQVSYADWREAGNWRAADTRIRAAARLGVDPAACLALEDSHNGVRAAHAAGMMTIMVPDLLEATQEMQALCVAVSETLHEVRALLEAQRRS